MTTTYTRLTTIKDKCWACMGNGHKWENVQHNQLIKCKCYICDGTGQREMVQSEDATIYVASLEIELKNLKALMAKDADIKAFCPRCGTEMINQDQFGWCCGNISCR